MRSILLVSIFAAVSAIPARRAIAGVGDDEVLRPGRDGPRDGRRLRLPAERRRLGQVARLTADDGVIGDRFGAFIATAGNRMIVGAPNADDGMGGVRLRARRGRDLAPDGQAGRARALA